MPESILHTKVRACNWEPKSLSETCRLDCSDRPGVALSRWHLSLSNCHRIWLRRSSSLASKPGQGWEKKTLQLSSRARSLRRVKVVSVTLWKQRADLLHTCKIIPHTRHTWSLYDERKTCSFYSPLLLGKINQAPCILGKSSVPSRVIAPAFLVPVCVLRDLKTVYCLLQHAPQGCFSQPWRRHD